MSTALIGFIGIFGLGTAGFILMLACDKIVNCYWPEQEQTTNQQLTVIHNETATRRTNKAA